MSHDPIVIVSAARTPMGSFQGAFADLSGPQLGGHAIEAALARSRIDPGLVEQALMGCVLQAGLGQAPARQAVLRAGLPASVACATIHKVCGSAMLSVMLGHDSILAGTSSIVVAGGMESMSNAPYLLPKARRGYRLGHDRLLDHMFLDGLEDAYSDENRGRLMGCFAEECAESYRFSREDQDAYSIRSTVRAKNASLDGSFDWEIAPIKVDGKKGAVVVEKDEGPFAVNLERVPSLKPAFKPGGTVTAANSSSISDGAAALVLARASVAERLGLEPVARIIGHAAYAGTPAKFPSAPVGAMRKLFQKTGLGVDEIDLFEINEAFAVVPMAAAFDLGLDLERVNVHGGACALGHPIGASGARILVTLLGALRKSGGKKGIASLCIGGGEATAMALEML
ncbi:MULTISPECIES: acetyl-CoA C-acyltransferase [unclassified Herbaspirillum]|uniref:acetyl-CoA C-acyltransferase n=1 Tax=unclassified Herbaspirillum TaxID=2624150 RepID=UPI001153AF62|nr:MULTISPECIES: acetyl-CoA C-acyltransferase [unclassified Herbaspirillum]MBB5391508.1 acetyl-CoA C-acetyltransferase [Herbaspirillum sp. SJZ102]TQK12808.1 acetyl-CoA C-acetyltransferase [Herbaspirillum sp. SJZ130]TQK14812.1 acetyl-CoA C-acetyltransferase [Herbaspirillum sp. SJZ106]TWC71063.1 acetyl-CoA C-acetyltransferase [Herbaspirillum sp. SJZ099]